MAFKCFQVCGQRQRSVEAAAVIKGVSADTGHTVWDHKIAGHAAAVIERVVPNTGNSIIQYERSDTAGVGIPGSPTGAVVGHGSRAGNGQRAVFGQRPGQIFAAGALGKQTLSGGFFRRLFIRNGGRIHSAADSRPGCIRFLIHCGVGYRVCRSRSGFGRRHIGRCFFCFCLSRIPFSLQSLCIGRKGGFQGVGILKFNYFHIGCQLRAQISGEQQAEIPQVAGIQHIQGLNAVAPGCHGRAHGRRIPQKGNGFQGCAAAERSITDGGDRGGNGKGIDIPVPAKSTRGDLRNCRPADLSRELQIVSFRAALRLSGIAANGCRFIRQYSIQIVSVRQNFRLSRGSFRIFRLFPFRYLLRFIGLLCKCGNWASCAEHQYSKEHCYCFLRPFHTRPPAYPFNGNKLCFYL